MPLRMICAQFATLETGKKLGRIAFAKTSVTVTRDKENISQ